MARGGRRPPGAETATAPARSERAAGDGASGCGPRCARRIGRGDGRCPVCAKACKRARPSSLVLSPLTPDRVRAEVTRNDERRKQFTSDWKSSPKAWWRSPANSQSRRRRSGGSSIRHQAHRLHPHRRRRRTARRMGGRGGPGEFHMTARHLDIGWPGGGTKEFTGAGRRDRGADHRRARPRTRAMLPGAPPGWRWACSSSAWRSWLVSVGVMELELWPRVAFRDPRGVVAAPTLWPARAAPSAATAELAVMR